MKVEVISDHAWKSLNSYAMEAICIRAVMAFWTIPAIDLPKDFNSALSSEGSFLCVDINQPTSINALNSLHESGVAVLLHLMTTTGYSEIEDSSKMPNHLMHSKAIIFDYADGSAVVWVGSHNGTFRALDGINFECSLAVETKSSTTFYQDVLAHINDVHAACQPFQSDLIDHYRYLQGSKLENTVSVMEFENSNDLNLIVGEQISIFNMTRDDLRSFKTIDTDVLVSLHGTHEVVYSAKVVQTGETPLQSSQSFSDRRYADCAVPNLPQLLGKTAVTRGMYKKGSYFAIMKIVSQIDPSLHLLELPSQAAWVDMPSLEISRFIKNEDADTKETIPRATRVKGLKFKVPAFEEMQLVSINCSDEEVSEFRKFAFKELALEEKRERKREGIVKKKLIVRR